MGSEQWSPIHAALGLRPSPLTLEIVQDAVDASVAESAALDWKRSLPSSDSESLDEFAKDVAAMANSGGGYLVYGVEEDRGRGTASKLGVVDISERQQNRLRAVAASRIHPLVPGVRFLALSLGSAAEGVLVVVVPPSADAPHVIGSESRLGVPYRDGSTTRWMRERDLERAYAERFRAREGSTTRLNQIQSEALDQVDISGGPWLVASATPRVQMSSVAPLSSQDFGDILRTTLRLVPDILGVASGGSVIVRSLGDAALNPRVGLRRWVATARSSGIQQNSPSRST